MSFVCLKLFHQLQLGPRVQGSLFVRYLALELDRTAATEPNVKTASTG